jgi:small neutral amino acid transporter SnatA (MarC family)
MIAPIASAALICAANSTAAVIVVKKAAKGDSEKFNKIVLSSLVIRFFIVVLFVFAGLMIFESERTVFALSFLIACFISILLEVIYINKFSKKLIKQKHKIQ